MIIAYRMLTILLLLQHVIYCVIVSFVINIFLINKFCNFIFVVIYVYIASRTSNIFDKFTVNTNL